MVPHIKIEEKLHELLEADGQVLAVTAIPDEKKGERLVGGSHVEGRYS